MATTNLHQTFNTFTEIFDAIVDKQTTKQTKSNTIVAAIGAVIVAVSVGLSTWAESAGVAPAWLPTVLFVLGMAGQVFGVSRTKNYVTPNIQEQFNREFARRIDEHHNHTAVPVVPEGYKLTPVAPTSPASDVGSSVDPAELLAEMVKRDAGLV